MKAAKLLALTLLFASAPPAVAQGLPESAPSPGGGAASAPAGSAPSSAATGAPDPADRPASAPVVPDELLPYVPLVDAAIEPKSGPVGTVFTYTLTIERGRGVAVAVPDPPPLGRDVAIRRALPARFEEAGEGAVREIRAYELQIFALGSISLPPFAMTFSAPGGSAQVSAPALSVEVPRRAAKGGDIKDAFTPREIAPTRPAWREALFTYGPYALAALLVAALLALLSRRRRAPEAAPPAPTPAEAALARLRALEAQRPRARELHLALSEILRAYLEDGLEIPARDATAGEIVSRVRRASPEGIDPVALEAFLMESDLVKFAGESPGAEGLVKALEFVRGLVNATRPAPETKPPKPGPGGGA
jgi:hypothetical protein